MTEWLKDYYKDSSVLHPEAVKKKIIQGKPPAGVYIITLSGVPGNMMEIMAAGLLRQKHLAQRCPKIIGIALGKHRAVRLAADIVKEVYEKTGGFEVADYLQQTRGQGT